MQNIGNILFERYPLVSIIVPVYNVKNYLEHCLQSITGQTYRNLEIILIDDGSTDGSGKMCDEWAEHDKRIIVLHQKNAGQACARNVGLSMSHGEYIEFVDSDDWIALDTVSYCLDMIEKYHGLDAVHFGTKQIRGKEGSSVSHCEEIYELKEKEILQWFMINSTITGSYSPCTIFFKKHIVENIYFTEGKINEDIAWKYKLLSCMKRMIISNTIKYFYFQRKGSTTTAGLRKRDFDLYDAAAELRTLTAEETYGTIRYLGEVKYARTPLSLLCKIAYYGIEDSSIEKYSTIKKLQRELQNNLYMLVNAPIPLSRKILAVMFSLDFHITEIAVRVAKSLWYE